MPIVPFAGRFGRRITTPDLYRLVTAALVMIGLCAGIAGTATGWHRSALTSDITGVSGPLSVGAQELYRSLSDADATATNSFLYYSCGSADHELVTPTNPLSAGHRG